MALIGPVIETIEAPAPIDIPLEIPDDFDIPEVETETEEELIPT